MNNIILYSIWHRSDYLDSIVHQIDHNLPQTKGISQAECSRWILLIHVIVFQINNQFHFLLEYLLSKSKGRDNIGEKQKGNSVELQKVKRKKRSKGEVWKILHTLLLTMSTTSSNSKLKSNIPFSTGTPPLVSIASYLLNSKIFVITLNRASAEVNEEDTHSF